MRKTIRSKAISGITAAVMLLTCAMPVAVNAVESPTKENAVKTLETGITIPADKISTENYKDTRFNNPISPDFFCADPTAVEYNGRLYVYGTNDHQQFEIAGPDKDNTYEKIKSLLVFSTDDMVNWTYHGEINVGEIAPWITASWAPSIVSRVESDGKTHFYLYFSNSGIGTGVITSTDPVTGWTDPLGHCFVTSQSPGIDGSDTPFDPGVVIDDNGVGWLAVGGGDQTAAMPDGARIVQLGDDMISFASDFKRIYAPYHFEANELNYINGTYVYTYCSNWADRSNIQWDYDCDAPGGCGMVYMTTKTPLDPDSWQVKGECFKQPGECGFDYSNNHTHMHKFKGKWYMFYHTLTLKHGMGITGAYRSMGVDEVNVDEENVTIEDAGGTKKGVKANGTFDPYKAHSAAELVATAQVDYDVTDPYSPIVIAKQTGSWTAVRGAQFTESEQTDPITEELEQMNIGSIQYNLTVTSVDAPTTITMHPSTLSGVNCDGTVDVTGKGKYTITCDMGGAKGFQNLGYFEASDKTPITFEVDSITLNGKYNIAVAAELTNTREWADGLRNVWNGFSDGDDVYANDSAALRYVKSDDAIELFAVKSAGNVGTDDKLVEKPLAFLANVKGTGSIEVHVDEPTGRLLTSIEFDSPNEFRTVYSEGITEIGGTHDLYFVYSDKDVAMQSWCFMEADEVTETLEGDVNADGKFNIADVVLLQKWLLNVPNTQLANWRAADLCKNSKLNTLDLCLMKHKLING